MNLCEKSEGHQNLLSPRVWSIFYLSYKTKGLWVTNLIEGWINHVKSSPFYIIVMTYKVVINCCLHLNSKKWKILICIHWILGILMDEIWHQRWCCNLVIAWHYILFSISFTHSFAFMCSKYKGAVDPEGEPERPCICRSPG